MIKRGAFTFIEIVMVIVVLGIVSMIGTDIIAKMYEGYIKTKVINKLQTRTDQVLNLIAKRLSYRIKDSAVTSIDGAPSTYKKLSETGITTQHNILEWIGYDNEGYIGEWDSVNKRFTGWSGFVDIDNTSTTRAQVVTSGSRLDLVKPSIDALSYAEVDLDALGSGVGLISKCNYDMEIVSYGYLGGGHQNVLNVKRKSSVPLNNILELQDPLTSKNICEQYYLVWSAYAIVPEGTVNGILDANGNKYDDFNLTLKYNYQPWRGEKYSDSTTKSAVLAEHVSTFRFIQTGHTIRVKLCMRDPQTTYGFCKEKAVF